MIKRFVVRAPTPRRADARSREASEHARSRVAMLARYSTLMLVGCAGAMLVEGCGSTTCADSLTCRPHSATGGASAGGRSGGDSGGSGASAGTSDSGGASGTSDPASAGASGESGAAGDTPSPCDPTKSPSEESCLISDDYAVFVAPTGKDGASGSKAGPVKTIAEALKIAGGAKRVIACDGIYGEQVKLTGAVKLYGGFTCPGGATPWSYEPGKKAKIAWRGLALSIASGAANVVIEDFEFDALDAASPGESSVAAFVNMSTSVAFTRVKLVAGMGVDGANGTLTPVTYPLPETQRGNNASGDTGAAAKLILCPVGGSTTGGAGGTGGPKPTGGESGTPALAAGEGGTVGASCGGVGVVPSGGGKHGAAAPSQAPSPGATKLGSITPTGWIGAPGTDGTPGTPGQGGGGGRGAASNTTTGEVSGGGGGGGAGGCGGAPGTAGKAGGASIALLVLRSTVVLAASELVASDAGRGGEGAAGQDGQTQSGGGGVQVESACFGGKGGPGGKGGAGGGAAGGVSLGIAYQGTAPITDPDTQFTTGAAGAKGIGGAPGTNDGIAGVAQDALEVP